MREGVVEIAVGVVEARVGVVEIEVRLLKRGVVKNKLQKISTDYHPRIRHTCHPWIRGGEKGD